MMPTQKELRVGSVVQLVAYSEMIGIVTAIPAHNAMVLHSIKASADVYWFCWKANSWSKCSDLKVLVR